MLVARSYYFANNRGVEFEFKLFWTVGMMSMIDGIK